MQICLNPKIKGFFPCCVCSVFRSKLEYLSQALCNREPENESWERVLPTKCHTWAGRQTFSDSFVVHLPFVEALVAFWACGSPRGWICPLGHTGQCLEVFWWSQLEASLTSSGQRSEMWLTYHSAQVVSQHSNSARMEKPWPRRQYFSHLETDQLKQGQPGFEGGAWDLTCS